MSIKDFRNKNKKFLDRANMSAIVDKSNLKGEMSKHSSDVYYYGRLMSDAEYLRDKAKVNIDVVEAKVDRAIRKSHRGGKLPSLPEIAHTINRNKDAIEANDKYLEAKLKHSHCVAIFAAIKAKGEQLTNIGHMHRKEMDVKSIKDKVKAINMETELESKKGRRR